RPEAQPLLTFEIRVGARLLLSRDRGKVRSGSELGIKRGTGINGGGRHLCPTTASANRCRWLGHGLTEASPEEHRDQRWICSQSLRDPWELLTGWRRRKEEPEEQEHVSAFKEQRAITARHYSPLTAWPRTKTPKRWRWPSRQLGIRRIWVRPVRLRATCILHWTKPRRRY